MNKKIHIKNTISWIFGALFFVISVLNIRLVHRVPGVSYFLLSLIYLPATNVFIKNKIGFLIPLAVKIIIGLIVLWGTLAVGDLTEILGL